MPEKRLGIYIDYIDRRDARSPWSMATMHAHKSHELYFLVSGQRRYFVGHSIYDVEPGNLVLIPKGMLHRTTAPGRAGYERYVINFFENYLQDFVALVGRASFDQLLYSGCVTLPADISRRVRQALAQLTQEIESHAPHFKAASIQLLQEILLSALRHGKPAAPCTGETADKIQHVARYISEHFSEPITLQSAAALAGMEETYFSKRFKLLTGFGFHEYLSQTRLLAAERMLDETKLSMVAIAERCGFSGSNYFGDSFRRWKGQSPSQYRKTLRAGAE